jgi:hypothetical protein
MAFALPQSFRGYPSCAAWGDRQTPLPPPSITYVYTVDLLAWEILLLKNFKVPLAALLPLALQIESRPGVGQHRSLLNLDDRPPRSIA